jgi:hypothetical protein
MGGIRAGAFLCRAKNVSLLAALRSATLDSEKPFFLLGNHEFEGLDCHFVSDTVEKLAITLNVGAQMRRFIFH